MNHPDPESTESILHLVRDALARGARVDIDGLGSFIPDAVGSFHFIGSTRPKVFITYVHEDAGAAHQLFSELRLAGFDPWMDRRKLLPGQNWPRAIEDAIGVSDFVVACFSNRSVKKKGGFQAEIRYALDCAQRMPLDEVFLVPVRLDDCPMPARIIKEVQYVDLFPHWDAGFRNVLEILRSQFAKRRA